MKTEIRSLLTLVCAVSAGLLVVGSPAQAGYIVTLEPVGSNVVATGSGAIDLTGLSFLGIFTTSPQVVPSAGEIVTGPTVLLSTVFGYTGISGPTNFGPGLATLASSGSGDVVGIISGQILDVPIFYVSGSPLSDTSTYGSATLNSLGVTPGTYEWTWGTGANQNFTLEVVPEPATWLATALVAIGLVLHFFIRRCGA